MRGNIPHAIGRAFADAEDDAYRFGDRYRIETIAFKFGDRAELLPDPDDRAAAKDLAGELSRLDHYLTQADKRYHAVRNLLEGGFEIAGYREAVERSLADLDVAHGLLEAEIARFRNRLWEAVPRAERIARLSALWARGEGVRAKPPLWSDDDIDWDGLRAVELHDLRAGGYGTIADVAAEA